MIRNLISIVSALVFCLFQSAFAQKGSTTAGTQELSPEGTQELIPEAFTDPPAAAGIRCWWWWLNGNVTKAAITRDLEAMKEKGFSGACIFDAGGHDQRGNGPVPQGPMFGSPEWLELFRFAVQEAARLDLVLSASIQSGWNLGGPDVKPQESAKHLTWSETVIAGGEAAGNTAGPVRVKLPEPPSKIGFYRDIAVLAFRRDDTSTIAPIANLRHKAAFDEAAFSASDTRHLLETRLPEASGKADAAASKVHAAPAEVINISKFMNSEGLLEWNAPGGRWVVLRFGYTNNGSHVSTSSGDWQGLVLDYMSEKHFTRYWNTWVRPMLESIGPLAGSTLRYLQTDSWEQGGINWTENFREEFLERRGYDLFPYLPVIAGKIIGSRDISNRFLADFRKTIGDCISDNHYRVFAEKAAEFGMGIQPESAGPHAGPFDGLKNYSHSEIMMSEFWSPSNHRPTPKQRFFVKQAASAAHIYNKKLVGAEGFTTIGKHWNDVIWADMKPSFDYSVCGGLTLAFLHTFTSSPPEMGLPGQEYFAGTHFNPNITWWKYAGAFFDYMARCQYMMQQGRFVADVLYYYGDHVPNIAILKDNDPAGALPGFDYDVINEDRLLALSVVNGRVTLPHGMDYRVLVIPDHQVMSLKALQKVYELVQAGATVIGPKTLKTVSLVDYPASEGEVEQIARELWGNKVSHRGDRKVGNGRMAWGYTAREWLLANNIQPDCFFRLLPEGNTEGAPADNDPGRFGYIHHRLGEADYYFIRSGWSKATGAEVTFRVSGMLPEFWDPVSGSVWPAKAWKQENGHTTVPVRFHPYGSLFVVFRRPLADEKSSAEGRNVAGFEPQKTLEGDWEVSFDPRWGGPARVEFDTLQSWTSRPEAGVRFYSGAAVYHKTFSYKGDRDGRLWLDLGDIRDVGVAHVKLNGKDLGTVWAPPFRVDISGLLKRKNNKLEVEVINSWRNRLVGDRGLPPEKRFTKTNITIRDDWELLPSGLLGPVVIGCDSPCKP